MANGNLIIFDEDEEFDEDDPEQHFYEYIRKAMEKDD